MRKMFMTFGATWQYLSKLPSAFAISSWAVSSARVVPVPFMKSLYSRVTSLPSS